MLKYNPQLKTKARTLRITLTDAEQRLWERLRRKQILGVQFYRQKPIGNYIVDFYAPAARLVVEVDGSHHHFDLAQARHDKQRSIFLAQQHLTGSHVSTTARCYYNRKLSPKKFFKWSRTEFFLD